MKQPNFNLVVIVLAVTSAFVVHAGITRDFEGIIDLGCNNDGCRARIEKVLGK